MVEPVVLQSKRNEEDTVRSYSVDEVIDGTSGFVTATRSGEGHWDSYDFKEAATPLIRVSLGDQERCVIAVIAHLAAQPPGYDEPGPPVTTRTPINKVKG